MKIVSIFSELAAPWFDAGDDEDSRRRRLIDGEADEMILAALFQGIRCRTVSASPSASGCQQRRQCDLFVHEPETQIGIAVDDVAFEGDVFSIVTVEIQIVSELRAVMGDFRIVRSAASLTTVSSAISP
jgi:hypothetical protein